MSDFHNVEEAFEQFVQDFEHEYRSSFGVHFSHAGIGRHDLLALFQLGRPAGAWFPGWLQK